MQAACITVNQLRQLLNVFFADNAKYEFAKKVYERTKDNADFIKLKEVFVDGVVKEKFEKFLQSNTCYVVNYTGVIGLAGSNIESVIVGRDCG